MERSRIRFALPGGRRVYVVYVPAKQDDEMPKRPQKPQVHRFDWSFAYHGILHAPFPTDDRPRGKRGDDY